MPRRAPAWATFALVLLALTTLGVGACDGEKGGWSAYPGADGPSVEDKRMAVQVRRYFRRNAAQAPWSDEIESITAAGGVVTVETTLDLDEPQGRKAAAEICDLIQGSDVADFTPGHTVRGGDGERVTCRGRGDPR